MKARPDEQAEGLAALEGGPRDQLRFASSRERGRNPGKKVDRLLWGLAVLSREE